MPISNFPFHKSDNLSSEKPLVPLIIYNPENGFPHNTWALIDTGADCTVIPEHIAKILYHNVRHPTVKRDVNFGIGGTVESFMHTFLIKILHLTPSGNVNLEKIAIKMPIKQYPVIPDLPIVILGEDDFLKNYTLTINYPRKKFSLKIPRRPKKIKK